MFIFLFTLLVSPFIPFPLYPSIKSFASHVSASLFPPVSITLALQLENLSCVYCTVVIHLSVIDWKDLLKARFARVGYSYFLLFAAFLFLVLLFFFFIFLSFHFAFFHLPLLLFLLFLHLINIIISSSILSKR